MTERLALLSAILASPDDDLPRLVFADWLEENGTTDADAARVEFIRLGCKSKAKTRMTPAEGKWLDANWRRLLGNTVAARPDGADLPVLTREGKLLRLEFFWKEGRHPQRADVVFQYDRGFVRRVSYQQGHSYQRMWQPVATDEPVAYHSPEFLPRLAPHPQIGWFVVLYPTTWSLGVFDRVVCPGHLAGSGEKLFADTPLGRFGSAGLHPLAVKDNQNVGHAQHHLHAAVATAMTTIAREYVGLAEPTPGG